MRTKEEYYDSVLENRRLAADPQVIKCSCPNTLCDWHSKCKECVALHRYHNDHVPVTTKIVRSDLNCVQFSQSGTIMDIRTNPTRTLVYCAFV